MLRVLRRGLLVLLTGFVGLLWTFTPHKLPVSEVPLGELPRAEPPAEMSLSSLPTGAMHSKAAFAYRGGSFSEPRDFTMTPVLVRHPRGDLLIDCGFGRELAQQVLSVPWLMRALSRYSAGTPAVEQLRAGGYEASRLAGILLTHVHWDHVSGVPDFPGVPVWMPDEEKRFVDSGSSMAALMHSFSGVRTEQYAWDGGPYLGYARSHDFYGDGSIVLVPSPGHTPGSVIVFLALPSGTRYALVGDLVWQREGLDIPAERPWASRWLVDNDAAQVRQGISHMAEVHKQFPQIVMVPAHDARAAGELPKFPQTRN
jgi:glyoxylase-like metal-dependent hydrolase (beta-lactamase superfamily II)